MNIKWIILAAATAFGLSAQTRLKADVPFPFEFRGQKMAAGTYEIVRTSVPNAIQIRDVQHRTAVQGITVATDQKKGAAGSSLIFEKAGDKYYFLSVVDRQMEMQFHVGKGRKHAEATVTIAAR